MKTFKLLFVCVALSGITACSQQMKEHSTADIETAQLASTEEASSASPSSTVLSKIPAQDIYSDPSAKLIKKATYRFEVADIKKSTQTIETAIKSYPAYIAASNLQLQNDFLENKITIRVQHAYFQALLNDIDKQALHVDHRNVTTNDVSKEFVDLESRLKTKREVEARYMDILRKKAGTIEELLNAEQQIGALHEEIEATISRINFLKDQVSYSSIELEFYQVIIPQTSTTETLSDKLLTGLSTGWEGIVSVLVVLSYVWPIYIGAALVLSFIYWRKKRQMSLPG